MPGDEPAARFASRGGLKLAAALDAFAVSPAGFVCADFGSHVGGFVDCLLQRGAIRVYSVDTSYGTLSWRLRRDPRVIVLERTNAIHVQIPEPVDLLTIDVGWTRQRLILPAAGRSIKPAGLVITLIKPHYEAAAELLVGGVLSEDARRAVVEHVTTEIAQGGWTITATFDSPIEGHGGNREVFALLGRR